MLFRMKNDFSLAEARAEYARLAQTLARPGWISEGYAQDRGPGAGDLVTSGHARS
jgi:hypothetical protein